MTTCLSLFIPRSSHPAFLQHPTLLSELSEQAILCNIKVRYEKEVIYVSSVVCPSRWSFSLSQSIDAL